MINDLARGAMIGFAAVLSSIFVSLISILILYFLIPSDLAFYIGLGAGILTMLAVFSTIFIKDNSKEEAEELANLEKLIREIEEEDQQTSN